MMERGWSAAIMAKGRSLAAGSARATRRLIEPRGRNSRRSGALKARPPPRVAGQQRSGRFLRAWPEPPCPSRSGPRPGLRRPGDRLAKAGDGLCRLAELRQHVAQRPAAARFVASRLGIARVGGPRAAAGVERFAVAVRGARSVAQIRCVGVSLHVAHLEVRLGDLEAKALVAARFIRERA